jgi:hypothetical protein
MSEQVRQQLQEVAEPVKPPADLAALAWAGAARRRRRKLAAGLTAAACAAAIGFVAVLDPAPRAARLPEAVRPADERLADDPAKGIQVAPSRSAEATLPWAKTALPRRIDLGAAGVVPLSTSPVRRALALLQPHDEATSGDSVLVLGDDGRLRRLEGYPLGSNPESVRVGRLTATSLSADGRFAAFTHWDRVVVVNLTDGTRRQYTVEGFNDSVRWHPDSRHLLVGGYERLFAVDTREGTVRRVPYSDPGSAFSTTGAEVWELRSHPARVVRWRDEKVSADRPVSAPISGWCGQGWARGDLLARSGAGSPAFRLPGVIVDGPGVVAVVDVAGGRVDRMLAFRPDERNTGCQEVLGWLGSATVLVASHGVGPTRVLAWDAAGGVRRVTELSESGTVALSQL